MDFGAEFAAPLMVALKGEPVSASGQITEFRRVFPDAHILILEACELVPRWTSVTGTARVKPVDEDL